MNSAEHKAKAEALLADVDRESRDSAAAIRSGRPRGSAASLSDLIAATSLMVEAARVHAMLAVIPDPPKVPCPACNGKGQIHHRAVMLDNWSQCSRCGGSGSVPGKPE